MIETRRNEIINLPGVIVPQCIYKAGKVLYIFDKINMDEGRLYRFEEDRSDGQLIIEVDDCECFFGKDGYVYMLYLNMEDENSLVEVYDLNGSKLKEIAFSGNVYHIDVDKEGNIYALFSEEEQMLVRIYDNNGNFMRTVHSRNLPYLTTVSSDGEDIYVAGFSQSTPLRIEKINCMSYIKDVYDLGIEDHKFIVSKILRYNDYLITVITGNGRDSIFIIDKKSGNRQQLDIHDMNIQYIYDVLVVDDELYLLGSKKLIKYLIYEEKTVHVHDASEGVSKTAPRKRYRYLSYLIYMKGLYKDLITMAVRVGVPLAMIAMLLGQYVFSKKGMNISIKENVRIFVVLSNMMTLLATLIRNMVVFYRKRLRLDNLLDIYNRVDTIAPAILKSSMTIGTMLTITAILMLDTGDTDSGVYIFAVVSFTIIAAAMYSVCMRCVRKFINDMDEMVFDLLSFGTKEHELFTKVGNEVRKLRKLGIEKYRIKILTETNIGNGVFKLASNWSKLRGKITGDQGRLRDEKNCIIFDLNLKNRDIKYSRISVIEDFICYIKKSINISSIVIEAPDDEECKA